MHGILFFSLFKSYDKHKSNESSVEFSCFCCVVMWSYISSKAWNCAKLENWNKVYKLNSNTIVFLTLPRLENHKCKPLIPVHDANVEIWNNNRAIFNLIEISRFSICSNRLFYYLPICKPWVIHLIILLNNRVLCRAALINLRCPFFHSFILSTLFISMGFLFALSPLLCRLIISVVHIGVIPFYRLL